MTLFSELKDKIPPQLFTRITIFVSAVVLIVIYPAMICFCPGKLPHLMGLTSHTDFYQYYAGATVVREGIWDSLYPIPKPGIYDQPNHFEPVHKTFLFNPESASREQAFYPILNSTINSDCAPKLAADFPEGVGGMRYIYPPPTALLVAPLALFRFDTAANYIFPTISIWFLWVLIYFAARIHRLLRQGDSYSEGMLILAGVIYALNGQTHIQGGNISPMLSALIAFGAYSMARGRLLAFSCAYIPLVLFKSLGLTWLVILAMNRAYWRSFAYIGLITVLLNGIVVGLAGFGVYKTFFSLLPLIGIPVGEGIVPALIQYYGFYPHTLYLVLNAACLGFLYYGYWKNTPGRFSSSLAQSSPLVLMAVLAGTMALFCLLNFSVWLQYCSNYLFFPFLGWILQEGYLARGRWRWFILGGTLFAFFVLTSRQAWLYLLGARAFDRYHTYLVEPGCVVVIPVFFLIVVFRRLFFCAPVAAPTVSR